MTEQSPSHEELSSAASIRALLQPPSRAPSSTPTPQPPPITLNPPSSQQTNESGPVPLSPPKPTPIPRSLFSAPRPPRSSSLLTLPAAPARPSSPSSLSSPLPLPLAVPGSASPPYIGAHRDNAHQHPPVSLKRPTTPAAQIEKINISAGSPREGSRARNRWSTSTVSSTSSRTSPYATRQTAASPNRRASLEVGVLHTSPPSATKRSPRLLHQDRLSPAYANPSTGVAPELGRMGTLAVAQPAMGYHGANRRRGPSPTPSRSNTVSEGTAPHHQHHDLHSYRGHSRERLGKGSNDLGRRAPKPPSQKAMLSRALQKANTAVQLDNVQNFEGARHAYAEACNLLHQVLHRTTIDEDKRKLEVIRQTYTSRIEELDQMAPWHDDTVKALPARPESDEYGADAYAYQYGPREPRGESSRMDLQGRTSPLRDEGAGFHGHYTRLPPHPQRPSNRYPRDASLERRRPSHIADHAFSQSSFSRGPSRLRSAEDLVKHHDNLAPPPLASLRSISPVRTRADDLYDAALLDTRNVASDPQSDSQEGTGGGGGGNGGNGSGNAQESSHGSWLDPIDESGGSTRTSVHSRTSSLGFRRRHIRAASGNTEAEFDSALDAAIEAAYNDGFEPMGLDDYSTIDTSEEAVTGTLRKLELARDKTRQAANEAHDGMDNLQKVHIQRGGKPGGHENGFYDEDNSSDEERILEEIARDFVIEDFTMGQQLRPVKESWRAVLDTRFASEFHPLSPLTEVVSPLFERMHGSSLSKTTFPSIPPPAQSLPELPPLASVTSTSTINAHNRQVRGPKAEQQLRIETVNLEPSKPIRTADSPKREPSSAREKSQGPSLAGPGPAANVEERSSSASTPSVSSSSLLPPLLIPPPSADISPSEPPNAGSSPKQKTAADAEDNLAAAPASPSINRLRKNFSSSSLRSMTRRNMSLSNLDEGSDMSAGASSITSFNRLPNVPALPATLTTSHSASSIKDQADMVSAGGLHLFDDTFHQSSSAVPTSPTGLDAPVPLEPCPADSLLRPFWLMRCLYQTLVHPRGGYLSTRLFVPRDAWLVKGVKLKNVEEKVSQCDFLTAALLKLAKVDTLDADALLVEMQDLESSLEQAQGILSRKLGSDVGVQGAGLLSKDGSSAMDGDGGLSVPRSGSVSGKSSGFSWRRLRSKPSGGGLGGSYASRTASVSDGPRDGTGGPLLPMTPKPTNRPVKRDLSLAQFIGPHAQYMASLAHLFDAAQAIDQIARQVEDPGLRHADKTQVGLELCTRHAAEFFGFYICRFVLADLGLLLDKFIKRGSEWVLN